MVQKKVNGLPHDLTKKAIERRKTMWEILLKRYKRKRIVTGDEKWIHYDNSKRQKAWVNLGEAAPSKPKVKIYGIKLMLSIRLDQDGVIFYEVLKPPETITADRYRHQMIKFDRAVKDKRPQYDGRHDKVILQHNNARLHVAKTVQETLQVLNWEILPHPSYSPSIAKSDYHLF